ALEAVWEVVQLGNQYVDKSAPWALAKQPDGRARLETVLYHAAETLRLLCLSLQPFMPQAAEELKRQLGLMLNFSKPLLGGDVQWGGTLPGTPIAKGAPLFPRIEPSKGDTPVTESTAPAPQPGQPTQPTAPATPAAPAQITIEDFQKIQLKVATVLTAERIPRSDKLLKLEVDLGDEKRQIVAGIGKRYEPQQVVGKRIVIVANLKPAKLMGIESQGMVLAAGDKDVGGLCTVFEDVPNGLKVK
ncbi:MAG TPA: methionine--tRNA ligase subunit beta, partial [Nitrospirales bacterium]|nr:methionine--tRNA ligase subunit beta [Nitrospirales bacterium]